MAARKNLFVGGVGDREKAWIERVIAGEAFFDWNVEALRSDGGAVRAPTREQLEKSRDSERVFARWKPSFFTRAETQRKTSPYFEFE